MAHDMGVEATFLTGSSDRKKRVANTSPMDPTGEWTLKCCRTSSLNIQTDKAATQATNDNNMELNFSMIVAIEEPEVVRDVVDPPQSPWPQ